MDCDKEECKIRDSIALMEKGKTEVTTPNGRIDILTATEIIEVKRIKKWKDAMGQVMAYGIHYPDHRKRVHLYGSGSIMYDMKAFRTLTHYGIRVTTENDFLASLLDEETPPATKPPKMHQQYQCIEPFLLDLIDRKGGCENMQWAEDDFFPATWFHSMFKNWCIANGINSHNTSIKTS